MRVRIMRATACERASASEGSLCQQCCFTQWIHCVTYGVTSLKMGHPFSSHSKCFHLYLGCKAVCHPELHVATLDAPDTEPTIGLIPGKIRATVALAMTTDNRTITLCLTLTRERLAELRAAPAHRTLWLWVFDETISVEIPYAWFHQRQVLIDLFSGIPTLYSARTFRHSKHVGNTDVILELVHDRTPFAQQDKHQAISALLPLMEWKTSAEDQGLPLATVPHHLRWVLDADINPVYDEIRLDPGELLPDEHPFAWHHYTFITGN